MTYCNLLYSKVEVRRWIYEDGSRQIKLKEGICLDASEPQKPGGLVHRWAGDGNKLSQHGVHNGLSGQIKSRKGIGLDASERYNKSRTVRMWPCRLANVISKGAYQPSRRCPTRFRPVRIQIRVRSATGTLLVPTRDATIRSA